MIILPRSRFRQLARGEQTVYISRMRGTSLAERAYVVLTFGKPRAYDVDELEGKREQRYQQRDLFGRKSPVFAPDVSERKRQKDRENKKYKNGKSQRVCGIVKGGSRKKTQNEQTDDAVFGKRYQKLFNFHRRVTIFFLIMSITHSLISVNNTRFFLEIRISV